MTLALSESLMVSSLASIRFDLCLRYFFLCVFFKRHSSSGGAALHVAVEREWVCLHCSRSPAHNPGFIKNFPA